MIVETKNLTKGFGSLVAVDNLNLKLKEKMIYGLVGPNGAGKTTTFAMLAGLINPTYGEIKIFGLDLKKDFYKIKSKIGILIQEAGFYKERTALDNLVYYAKLKNIKNPRKEAIDVLKKVGLEGVIGVKVKNYSHGMERLLSIAQALLGNPDFIILDEPTSGLDPQNIYRVKKLIKSFKNKTLLISSHNLEEIEKLCTHVGIMNKGKIILEKKISKKGSLEKLFIKLIK